MAEFATGEWLLQWHKDVSAKNILNVFHGSAIWNVLPLWPAAASGHTKPGRSVEPAVGLEPTTYGLQNRCSTR